VCAAYGHNQTKLDIPKVQTRKMTPYAREKQKLKIFLKIICFLLYWVFTHCHFCWYNWGTPSKDHTGTLCQHRRKGYPISWSRASKNHTYPAARTYVAHIGEYLPPGSRAAVAGNFIVCKSTTSVSRMFLWGTMQYFPFYEVYRLPWNELLICQKEKWIPVKRILFSC